MYSVPPASLPASSYGDGVESSGRGAPTPSRGELRRIFERFDANRSGKLDYRELRNALQAMGLDVSEQKAAQLLQDYDRDGNGLMEINEFVQMVGSLRAAQLSA